MNLEKQPVSRITLLITSVLTVAISNTVTFLSNNEIIEIVWTTIVFGTMGFFTLVLILPLWLVSVSSYGNKNNYMGSVIENNDSDKTVWD